MRRRVGAQDRRLEQVSRLLSTRDAQRYQLVRELGRGTFGTAHLARDTRLERLVVLKQPRAAWALGAEGRQAFLQEARLAAKVHHANVVTVLEVLPESDPPVLVMEYVEGGSLEEQMGRGPLPLAQACYIVADVLEGLQAIHESGIVHRDLKPGNVLLDDRGRAKVGDFGIAGPPTAAPEVAPTWGAMTPGSLAYMSPEQINGDAVGPASDLHAAGILLHELLAGQRPYRASRPEELWREIAAGRTHVGRSVPARLRPFLAGLLAKDPSKRPASAAQAADQLRALAAQPESRRAVG
ncbi:MAG TPA: serine/threonine-protein kinase [Candidatus Thermoplasmatota archaeon]|nr:serine/threonine-protein kinase [Candidatus Thermoplasmatota archaeon]